MYIQGLYRGDSVKSIPNFGHLLPQYSIQVYHSGRDGGHIVDFFPANISSSVKWTDSP